MLQSLWRSPLLGLPLPPPTCRVNPGSGGTTKYECVLCQSTAPKLRSNTRYFVNADCSFNPRSGVVAIDDPIIATTGVILQPMIGAMVQLYGTLHVSGSDVQVINLVLSHRIQTVTSKAQNLLLSNVVVSEDTVGFSVDLPHKSHEVSLDKLRIQNLKVPNRVDNTVATLYHSVGDVTIMCNPGENDRIIIQPIVSDGVSFFPNCQVINMSAIFDALGSSYVYDSYSMEPPQWVIQLRQWALTFTIGGIVILLARYLSSPPQSSPPTPPTTSATATPNPTSNFNNPLARFL